MQFRGLGIREIPDHRPIEILGAGGFGVTFKAQNKNTYGICAVKVLKEGVAYEEAQRLSVLERHTNVARILDVKEGRFLVMEFVEGETLEDLLREHGPFSADAWLPYFRGILKGLNHLHSAGIVHRDVKPDNVIVNRNNGESVLIDFGAARETGKFTRSWIGHPSYSAPGTSQRPFSPRPSWDIYSLSVVTFKMLFGYVPCSGDDGGVNRDDRLEMIGRFTESGVDYVRAIGDGLSEHSGPESIIDWLCRMVTSTPEREPVFDSRTGWASSRQTSEPPTLEEETLEEGRRVGPYDERAEELRLLFKEGDDWRRKDILGAIVDEMKLTSEGSRLYQELREKKKSRILRWLVDEHAEEFVKWYESETEPTMSDLREKIATDLQIPLRSFDFYWLDGSEARDHARRDKFFKQWDGVYGRRPDQLPTSSIDDKTVAWLCSTVFDIYGLPTRSLGGSRLDSFAIVGPPSDPGIYHGNTKVRNVRVEWREWQKDQED